jgi:hypothetical protein
MAQRALGVSMPEQIINVVFNIQGRVQLDLARAEEDPWWETYSRGLDLNEPVQFQQAVANYISAYLRNEELLSDAPFTCGPANIYQTNIEVKSGNETKTNEQAV